MQQCVVHGSFLLDVGVLLALSIEAIDEIRDVESQADEIVRAAIEEARARVAAAEERARESVVEAERSAIAEAARVEDESRARRAAEADKAKKQVESKVKELDGIARSNWDKALKLAAGKVLSSIGDL
ncbi:MAG: hypothetical protein WBL79_01850 [Bacillota bacterium]|nr:hypothetical protein [Bacillota bacterium]HPZ14445.1 hypothetical protein [Bacillota bacterium]HQD81048.1 hypothetical protein [Bacillota bacterium]